MSIESVDASPDAGYVSYEELPVETVEEEQAQQPVVAQPKHHGVIAEQLRVDDIHARARILPPQASNLNKSQQTELASILKARPSEERDQNLEEFIFDVLSSEFVFNTISRGDLVTAEKIILELIEITNYIASEEYQYIVLPGLYMLQIVINPIQVEKIVEKCLSSIEQFKDPNGRYQSFVFLVEDFVEYIESDPPYIHNAEFTGNCYKALTLMDNFNNQQIALMDKTG